MNDSQIDEEKVYDILVRIIEIDQERISSLDSTKFTIKGWSITLASVLVGLTFQYKNKVFLSIGIVATIFFGILDYLYRRVQLDHVERSCKLQNHLKNKYLIGDIKNEIGDLKLFNIYKKKPWKDNSTIILFHFSIIILLFITYISL